MAKTKNKQRILMGKPPGKRPLESPRRRWKESIKTYIVR